MVTSVLNEIEAETSPILNELVRWVKTLTSAGVSPDKAVEVASDFMLTSMMSECCDEEEYDLDDEDNDE